MKKSVSVLIAFFCSFSCALIFSNVLRAEDNENLIEIAPYSDGVMILKSKGDVSGTLVIPEQIAGKPVRCIGEKAFQSNKLLTEVVLPGGLKTIRNNAFEFCQSLTTVEFPESPIPRPEAGRSDPPTPRPGSPASGSASLSKPARPTGSPRARSRRPLQAGWRIPFSPLPWRGRFCFL